VSSATNGIHRLFPSRLRSTPKKDDHHRRRHQHIHSKERADPAGEQLREEQAHVQPMLQHPGNELHVRQHQPGNRQQQVNRLGFMDGFSHAPPACESATAREG